MIKLSDFVIQFVEKLGVKHVFLLPGGGSMHLVDSVGRSPSLEPVCCLHEQAVAIAADAYSQYTNKIGVAIVTTGPGGTNAITGVAASWIDSVPVLVLSGQVKRSDLMGNSGVRQMGVQEVDIVSLVKPITKYAITVTDPTTIRFHLEKASHLAKSGRPGPVWIDLPLDVQGSAIDETTLSGFTPEPSPPIGNSLKDQARETIRLFNESERPVILAGNGIRLSGGVDEFLSLVQALKAPILTTWRALDLLLDDHEFFLGRPGTIAQRGANFIQQNADLIITIGARLDLVQVGYNHENFAPHARKVVVDIDRAEIGKLRMKIDVPVVGDAKQFIRELSHEISDFLPKDRSAWLGRCREWKKRYPVILPEYRSAKSSVHTYVLIDELSELLTADDVLVPGSSGGCAEITMQAFEVKEGQRIFNSPGLGSMGFGLPASIGAALASGKRTITIIGDGGLQHNIQELETVARLNLPLKIIVLNNDGYASIRHTQKNLFGARYVCCDRSSGLTLPDLEKIAFAYGIRHMKASNHDQLRTVLERMLESEGPVICEVMVDPAIVTAPRLSSEVRSDGSIVSKPMEDLWPFLDREELNGNMIKPPPKGGGT